MKKMRVVVLISGRGSNLEAILRAVQEFGLPVEMARVISDKADAVGLKIAAGFGVRTSVVEKGSGPDASKEFETSLLKVIAAEEPELVVLAGFMRILPSGVVAAYPNRIINIHPSLLPSFPGLRAQRQALRAGVKFAGCTVHFVINAVDAGPIIAQACVPVLPGDTEDSLSARILKQEHRLLPAVVAAIAAGKIPLGGPVRIERGTENQVEGAFISKRPLEKR
jgi:phosphoribosylglycinamide formyltransferase-1